ncbi:DUF378 domain-containing protein [Candidatus Neptunochlamydia vexilliferae]|uniref:DUF378 domain-containing protein n=1 Tax=Candidatus Neptunichlamydia vexilliferae TaxID=1651774 RepID=UPI0018919F44|nr:DUF378 domain-containing protein [Candidatus Neptunochlamydia vexilliferae]
MKRLDGLAVLFLVLGGIVWGFVGLYRLNLVECVFDREWLVRIIYVLFGVAFIYHTITWSKDSKKKKTKR